MLVPLQNIGIKSEQDGLVNYCSITGHTVTYNEDNLTIEYIRPDILSAKKEISTKQLYRYRKEIEIQKSRIDARLYYHSTDGKYFYSEKILEKRKYKVHKEEAKPTIKAINHQVQGFTPTLLQRIKNHNWTFAAGVHYQQELQIEDCVGRMKEVNGALVDAFPGINTCMFFTTEKNPGSPGYHNHLVILIDKNISANKIKATLCKAGTSKPWAKEYNSNDNYIEYMVKEIDLMPDGWEILTTSQMVYDALISNLPGEALYVPNKRKEWPQRA